MHEERSRTGAAWPKLPVLLAVVLAIAMTWPLVLHLGRDTAQETYDAPFQTWQVAWIGHALLHDPLRLFQANIFWPDNDSLAFSDAMIGYAPAGLIAAHGVHAALIVENLLTIFAYGLAFFGAYVLARELGAGTWGGLAAGAAFAYAPWRLVQTGHLHVISSGGIPLTLYLLLRGYRRGNSRTILAGWLVAAWQMTLGFTLGLQLLYLLLVLAALAAFLWVWRGRPRPNGIAVGSSLLGIAVFAAVTALIAQPYLRVLRNHPEARKTAAQVAFFSPPPRGFLAAPTLSGIWAGPTAHWRETLSSPGEQALFPGVTILLLALLGLGSMAFTPRLRAGLAVGTVACGVLSLGLPSVTHPEQGFTPYRFLYDYAPGWDGVRTPGRINTLTSLGLALLAGAGLALILRSVRRFSGGSIPPLIATIVLVAILAEGFGPLPHPRLPSVPPGQRAAPAPQLHLPTNQESLYVYWSIDGFPEIVEGIGSFIPRVYAEINAASVGFPDAGSVAFLRRLGLKTVILHRDLAFGTPWQNAGDRPIAGLGITRHDEGNLVVYRLEPQA